MSTAVGPRSSRSASRKSLSTPSTSIAGYFKLFSPEPRAPSPENLPEHVLDPIEQIPFVGIGMRPRLEFFLGQRFRQLLEQVPLFFGEFLRRVDLHSCEQIAASASVDVRHALAAQLESGAGLRAFRDLDVFRPV